MVSISQSRPHDLHTNNDIHIHTHIYYIYTLLRQPRHHLSGTSHTQVEDRKNIVKQKNDDISKAKNIVISGGGPVSIELASDIKLRNKGKTVTLVIPRTKVLEKMGDNYSAIAEARLLEIGVVIVKNERVVDQEGDKVNLKSKKTLPAGEYVCISVCVYM